MYYSARVLLKSSDLLLEAQEALYTRLVERFPKSVDLLDRGLKTFSYASKVDIFKVFVACKNNIYYKTVLIYV